MLGCVGGPPDNNNRFKTGPRPFWLKVPFALLPPSPISPASGVGAPAWRAGATASSTPTMSWRDLAGPGRSYREGELPGAPPGASNEGELPGAPHLATQADARSGIVPPRASQADVRSGVVPPHACLSGGNRPRSSGRPDATPGPDRPAERQLGHGLPAFRSEEESAGASPSSVPCGTAPRSPTGGSAPQGAQVHRNGSGLPRARSKEVHGRRLHADPEGPGHDSGALSRQGALQEQRPRLGGGLRDGSAAAIATGSGPSMRPKRPRP